MEPFDMKQLRSGVKADFASFLYQEIGCSGRGTVSTFVRALDVLDEALRKSGGAKPFAFGIWEIESPVTLLALHAFVVEQQRAYATNKDGIFSSLKSGGRSYYKNRWCSAAVRHLAAYRQTRQYEANLQSVFDGASNGKEVSARTKGVRFVNTACFVPEHIDPSSKEGKEAVVTAKRRINQNVFRSWIVNIYGNECCVTGLNVPELLRASHIVPWASDAANRMNPSNGLCLSATYDAAFDRHLISFDDDYRMILSARIQDYCTRSVCAEYFKKFEGVKIKLPSRFLPDRDFLEKHRSNLVA